MRAARAVEAVSDAGEQLGQILADGTAALAHLDAESLELLQVRAMQLHLQMNEGTAASSGSVKTTLGLAARHRVFAEVLRATGEHLKLLRRMNGRETNRQGKVISWDR